MTLWQKQLLCLPLFAVLPVLGRAAEQGVSYNFQVRPILTDHCFKCHGPDEKQRKGKLRLDERDAAIVKKAIIPGDPEASEMMKRMHSTDDDEIMPPPKERRPMTPEEIEVLRKWIVQGAPYEKHWAFIPLERREPPQVSAPGAVVHNGIDPFVLARLEREGLSAAAPAKKEEWLRRVSFDLNGLPPTLAEIDEFLADESPSAYEKVVDRLLASKAYGERLGVEWLDAARFADTYGRHEDDDCETWPWRDWVIRAFNSNMPYDTFVKHQIAGDLMPDATRDMMLATAFNRLAQQSNESGSNEEEFRQEIVNDRMKTIGTALLGLSLDCCRCHNHKYDPVTMRDYYSMTAFMNNIDELGLYSRFTEAIPAPSMFVYEEGQEARHHELKAKIAGIEAEMKSMLPGAREEFEKWLSTPHEEINLPKPLAALSFDTLIEEKHLQNDADPSKPASIRLKSHLDHGWRGKSLVIRGDNSVSIPGVGDYSRTHPFSTAIWLKIPEAMKKGVVIHHSRAGLDAGWRGFDVVLDEGRVAFSLAHFAPANSIRIRMKKPLAEKEWVHIAATYDGSSRAGGMHLYLNGEPADCEIVRDNLYKDIVYDTVTDGKDDVENAHLGIGGRYNDVTIKDAQVDEFRFFDRELSAPEIRLMTGDDAETFAKPDTWLGWWLREKHEGWKQKLSALQQARDEENKFAQTLRETMVMKEWDGARRRTFILTKGRFDQHGEEVLPDTPPSVLPFPKDSPRNRVGFAEWLVDRKNPLPSRVFVNRVWQMFFGRGIAVTSEDLGAQGQLPTHPELLDWLSVWFMDNGWDVKKLCKLIALSATYRQSTIPVKVELLNEDPENRLLARGPRQRLTAEQMRDNALSVSGLLSRKMGGAPVKPYQPAGLWEDSGTQHEYAQDHGDNLYRRSLYTFWRRTLPPPSMVTFDAPTREFCKARRDRSASPMQALVVFNDTQFLEAARVLAENLVRQFPQDDLGRVKMAYRMLTSKQVDGAACGILTKLLQDEREHFKSAPQEAEDIRRKNGERKPDQKLPAAEVAATTMLVRGLFAYDEAVMKP